MKLLLIGSAALFLGACVPIDEPTDEPTCGAPNEPVVVSYTKSGFPIYDDQAPLSVPCVEVTPPNTSTPPPPVNPPVEPPVPPVEPPEPPVEPPVEPPLPPVDPPSNNGCNNGHGNLDDCSPGNSGDNNNAENSGNSGDGNSGKGGGGKPFDPPNDN